MKTVRRFVAIILVLVLSLGAMDISALADAVLKLPSSLKIIEKEAFYGDTSIEQVVLPETVTEIRSNAFSKSSLKEINLPDSLTSIQDDAFDDCDSVVFHANAGTYANDWLTKRGYYNFTFSGFIRTADENGLPDVTLTILQNDETIQTGATDQQGCFSFDLPAGEYTLKASLAGYCDIKEEITLSENLERDFTMLPAVTVSGQIQDQENGAGLAGVHVTILDAEKQKTLAETDTDVEGRFSLALAAGTYTLRATAAGYAALETQITVSDPTDPLELSLEEAEELIPSPVEDFEFSVLSDTTCEICGYIGEDTEIVIPDKDAEGRKVIAIDWQSFLFCNFTSVIIPMGVTSIGGGAFMYCESLKDIVIPDSVTSIGGSAFASCSNLMSIMLPESVTCIENSTFEGCRSLTSISIPEGVTSIGERAFSDCCSLMNVIIPERTITIGENAFGWCSSLTTVTIPKNVVSIGNAPFVGCSSLNEIIVASGNEKFIELEGVLFDRNITELIQFPGGKSGAYVIPSTVTNIGDSVFDGCSGLTSISIPDSVTYIGYNTFIDCSNLTNVIMKGVTSIGDSAFRYCRSLRSITLPEGMISISYDAFYDCSNLTSILIPSSVTNIEDDAFSFCDKLTIYGEAGSYAEKYAAWNYIPFTAGILPLAEQFRGSFTQQSLDLEYGHTAQVSGTVSSVNAPLSRVTLSIHGYNIEDDPNDRYATVNLSGKDLYSIRLEDYPVLSLDASKLPLNTPGTYTVELWAKADGMEQGTLLDTMNVNVTVPDTGTLFGTVTTVSGIPIANVYVSIAESGNEDQIAGFAVTDQNGQWSCSGLDKDKTYIVSYYHSDYTFDTTSTNPQGTKVTGTLAGENNDINISFTMKKESNEEVSSIVVGTAVTFEIDAPGASYVRLVVDGTAYDEYMLNNDGHGIFDRVFSKAGERQVAFQAIKQGEYEYGSACAAKPLSVTSNDGSLTATPLSVPAIDKINYQSENYTAIINEQIPISWWQVENADYYYAYLYDGDYLLWSEKHDGKTNTSASIPAIEYKGTYTVVIMASGAGYNQSKASATLTVRNTNEALVIANADEIKNSALGGSFMVEVDSCYPNLYKKLVITPPNSAETIESDVTQGDSIYIDFHKIGNYSVRAIASTRENFTASTALYSTDAVTIAVDTNPHIRAIKHDGKTGTYGLHYDTEDMTITVVNTFVADSVKVFEGDTLICEGVRSNLDNYWYAYDCVMPKAKLGEGKHTLTIKAYFNDDQGNPQLIDEYDYIAYIIHRIDDNTQYYLGTADRLLTGSPEGNEGFNKAAGTPVRLHGNYGTQKYVELGKGTFGFVSAELRTEWVVEKPINIDPEKIQVFVNAGLAQKSIVNWKNIPVWNVPITENLDIVFENDQINMDNIEILYYNYNGNEVLIEDEKITSRIIENQFNLIMETPEEAGTIHIAYKQNDKKIALLFITVYTKTNKVVYPFEEYITLHETLIYDYKNTDMAETNNNLISWETTVSVMGQVYYKWYYVKYTDINNTEHYGYIRYHEASEEKNIENKIGYIIISEDIWNNSRGTAKYADEKVTELFELWGIQITKCIPNTTRKWNDFLNVLQFNTIDADFNDTLYVYILAHGYLDVELAVELQNRKSLIEGFIPIKAHRERYIIGNQEVYCINTNDVYPYSDFTYRISCFPGQVVIIMDSCLGGRIVDYTNRLNNMKKTIITSADKDESAGMWSYVSGNGLDVAIGNLSLFFQGGEFPVFTKGLYEKCKKGWNGFAIADKDKNGNINVRELLDAVPGYEMYVWGEKRIEFHTQRFGDIENKVFK